MPSKHESKFDRILDQLEDTEATLAKLRKKEVEARVAARKRETQVKIELGGLVRKAGLDRFDTTTILGVMMLAVERLERPLDESAPLLLRATDLGIRAFAGDSKSSDPPEKRDTRESVNVSFAGEPSDVAKIALRALRFRHDPNTGVYRGRTTAVEFEAYLRPHGARLVDVKPAAKAEPTPDASDSHGNGTPADRRPDEHDQENQGSLYPR